VQINKEKENKNYTQIRKRTTVDRKKTNNYTRAMMRLNKKKTFVLLPDVLHIKRLHFTPLVILCRFIQCVRKKIRPNCFS